MRQRSAWPHVFPSLDVRPNRRVISRSRSPSPADLAKHHKTGFFPGLDHRQSDARRGAAPALCVPLGAVARADGWVGRRRPSRRMPAGLVLAYDDAAGVTAGVQPQPAGAHQPRARRHVRSGGRSSTRLSTTRAKGRIEMHLESTKDQDVKVRGPPLPISRRRRGSTRRTPTSTRSSNSRDLARLGWLVTATRVWADKDNLFSVHELTLALGCLGGAVVGLSGELLGSGIRPC